MGQNPQFYVTPTSGVLELVFAARHNYSESLEFKAQDQVLMEEGFRGFCHDGLLGYYNAITDKPYVLDKSRGWGYYQDFLDFFYPDPKIVCMIRDPRSIFSSMEKNHRKNPERVDGVVNDANMAGITVEKRIDTWVQSQPVGLAFERLKDIIDRGNDEYMHFIKYEDLCKDPQTEIDALYDYLEVTPFKHNFEKVEQITVEDDSVYGTFGDHTIRSKVEVLEKDYKDILGVEPSKWIRNYYQWFFERFKY